MPVKRDESGRRSVQAEVEVPGTPEQVWDAIATGHGISAWFVPTEVEEREGGEMVLHFSPDGTMDARATITGWDAPRRMTAKGLHDPAGPEIATEWTVEARAGGTCTVRVVHSWFASTDDWDAQFEGTEHGWVGFFRILRLYLEHFPGQSSAALSLMGMSKEAVPAAWQALVGSLGITSAAEGQRVATAVDRGFGGDAPTLAGRVVRSGSAEHPELLIHLDAPAPGVVHMIAVSMGGTLLSVRVFFYGAGSADVAAREEPKWRAWMETIAQA